jgi:hypothetical protein
MLHLSVCRKSVLRSQISSLKFRINVRGIHEVISIPYRLFFVLLRLFLSLLFTPSFDKSNLIDWDTTCSTQTKASPSLCLSVLR